MRTANDIDREAANWIAHEDAADGAAARRRELDAWLAADVRHRIAYLRLKAGWERSLIAGRLRPLNGPVDRDLLAPAAAMARGGARRRFAIAAAVAALCVGLAASMWLWRTGEKVYSTGAGSLERILLEDGSSVDLNTDSEIAVRMSSRHRHVTLRRGEAHFRVARDASRPFDVLGGGRKVRAVGTAFLVRLKGERHAEVLVTEGRVIITPADGDVRPGGAKPPLVVAGEEVTVERDRYTLRKVPAAAVATRLAWMDGKIVLDEEPLARAVEQFNRYNRVKMIVGDPALEDIRVGGTFDARDTESFLAALRRVFEIVPRDAGSEAVTLVREQDAGAGR